MASPDTHMSIAFASLSGVVAFLFDVPAPVVFAGFMGTIAGQAIAPATSYLRGLFIVFIGTFASGYATPLLIKYLGDYSARGVAFFAATIIFGFRTQIIEFIKKQIAQKGDNNAV